MLEERRCSYEVCKLLHEKGFDVKCTDWYWENNINIWKPTHRPTTKEQKEFLFQKMRKAGYEWDKDKKELIKL